MLNKKERGKELLNVATNQGDFAFAGREELLAFIEAWREEFPQDEIWIAGTEKYPCLALQTNGEYACVNYFEDEEGNMWLSRGNLETEITYYAAGETWNAPADASVRYDEALAGVAEFCETMQRPACLDWQAL